MVLRLRPMSAALVVSSVATKTTRVAALAARAATRVAGPRAPARVTAREAPLLAVKATSQVEAAARAVAMAQPSTLLQATARKAQTPHAARALQVLQASNPFRVRATVFPRWCHSPQCWPCSWRSPCFRLRPRAIARVRKSIRSSYRICCEQLVKVKQNSFGFPLNAMERFCALQGNRVSRFFTRE